MKKLLGFCNRITPPNWHVTAGRGRFVFQGPGTLNIHLRILDHFIDGWIYAFKKGSMSFYPVSLYSGQNIEALKSFHIYGEHLIAESEIWLYPEGCQFFGDDLFAAIVHELAHVAVDRWLAFKRRSPKASEQRLAIEEEPHHGELFCRAFENLIRRAKMLGGEDHGCVLDQLKFELDNYRCEITI